MGCIIRGMKALLLAVTLVNPILFVTQVAVPADFTTVASAAGEGSIAVSFVHQVPHE